MNLSNVTLLQDGVVPNYLIPIPMYYIIGTGLLFVVLFGPFMNATSLAVFAKNSHLRSPTNVLVISLLLGDLGMSCVASISMMANFRRYYFWGDGICVFEGFWLYLMGLTNLYTHAVIAVDRYIVIAKPLKAHRITNRTALLVVIVVWIQGFFWASFPHFGWGKYTYEPARTSCAVEWDSKEIGSASYNIAITIWSLCIPLVVIFVSYYHVIRTIRHIARSGVWDMGSRIARKNLRIERKMFKTIAYMLGSYIWSWTPYTVVSMWAIIGESRDIPIYIITIPAVVAKSSCIWDPLIYVWTNRQFRIAFFKTLPCKTIGRKLLERDEMKNKEMETSEPQEAQQVRPKVTKLGPSRPAKDVGVVISVSEYGQPTETEGVSQIPLPDSGVPGPSKSRKLT